MQHLSFDLWLQTVLWCEVFKVFKLVEIPIVRRYTFENDLQIAMNSVAVISEFGR